MQYGLVYPINILNNSLIKNADRGAGRENRAPINCLLRYAKTEKMRALSGSAVVECSWIFRSEKMPMNGKISHIIVLKKRFFYK